MGLYTTLLSRFGGVHRRKCLCYGKERPRFPLFLYSPPRYHRGVYSSCPRRDRGDGALIFFLTTRFRCESGGGQKYARHPTRPSPPLVVCGWEESHRPPRALHRCRCLRIAGGTQGETDPTARRDAAAGGGRRGARKRQRAAQESTRVKSRPPDAARCWPVGRRGRGAAANRARRRGTPSHKSHPIAWAVGRQVWAAC